MTIKIIRRIKFGNGFGVIAEFTGDKKVAPDTGYPTGGYSITPSQLGLHTIENVLAQSPASSNLWEYDLANNKLKILQVDSTTGALEEVAAESDQSGAVTRIVAFGW
jgi:hypothetical protein